jgi:hypothetical protein
MILDEQIEHDRIAAESALAKLEETITETGGGWRAFDNVNDQQLSSLYVALSEVADKLRIYRLTRTQQSR